MYIYRKTISVKLIKDIYIGSYIYILISPKLLVSDKLYKVLIDLIFYSYIALIVCYGPSIISVTVTKGGYLSGKGLYRTSKTIGRGVSRVI